MIQLIANGIFKSSNNANPDAGQLCSCNSKCKAVYF